MPVVDSSMKRLIAFLAAPIFLALNGEFGFGVDADTQKLLIELAGAYIVTSKGGEVLIKGAEEKAKVAASNVTITNAATILERAKAEGKAL